MKRLAVVHPDITLNGGGEAVCAHVLNALCDHYEVTLVTWSPADFKTLDDLYSTNLQQKKLAVVTVEETNWRPDFLSRRSVVRYALAVRYVQEHLREYDAVISTWCEIAIDKTAIQYIHVPLFIPGVDHEILSGELMSTRQKMLWRFLRSYARRLARGSYAGYKKALSVANSGWTAQLVRDILHVEPVLIWPPIPKPNAKQPAWNERDESFVCVGRLVPGKRILELIDCVEKIHRDNPAVRLHVVGSGSGTYADAVRKRCEQSDAAIFEGRLSNEDLFSLFARSKFGIHGFPHEHFGIALAQMVMAGCLCFAPASGGQAELLAGLPDLLYADFEDAFLKISQVIRDPARQLELLNALKSVRSTLDQHDFQASFLQLVRSQVDNVQA